MAYSAKRPRALELALSILASESAAVLRPVLDAVIQSRGVILDELAARAKAGDTSDRHAASLSAAAIPARQRFANLVVRSLQEQVPRAVFDEARQQKEGAERVLAESSADARAEMRRMQVGVNEVDGALPRNSVLVSFVTSSRTRALSTGPRRRPPAPGRPVPGVRSPFRFVRGHIRAARHGSVD